MIQFCRAVSSRLGSRLSSRLSSRLCLQVVLAVLAALCAAPVVHALPALIPEPQVMTPAEGSLDIPTVATIAVPSGDGDARAAALTLCDWARRSTGLRLSIVADRVAEGALIRFERAPAASMVREGYQLDIDSRVAVIRAADASGLFYGAVTLWQLLETRAGGGARLGALHIEDQPRAAWRGLMLDSARHFQPVEFVHQYIEWMAQHKLNVLHWHLTDDQGWRLEIRHYPRLIQIGAWRVPAGRAYQRESDASGRGPRKIGGFYSQRQVRELVDFARRMRVTIVPEIDMPGHMSAAIAAYPWLGARPGSVSAVPADWGIYPNLLNLDARSFRFVEDVLAEVMALFPSTFIGIGGDEVQVDQWRDSSAAQMRMHEAGLTDPGALQGYFTQRVAHFLARHGRRAVGWDEILQPGLPSEAVVMTWRGTAGALAAAEKGFDTVVAPDPALYLDHRQSDAPSEIPGRLAVLSLEDVYRYDPLPDSLEPTVRDHVLGLQANLWTEHVRLPERAAAMTWPRAAALAEVAWTRASQRHWPDFVARVAASLPRWSRMGMGYSDSAFLPRIAADYDLDADRVTLTLADQVGYGQLHYTLDGSEPGPRSQQYQGPFTVALPVTLAVTSFDGVNALAHTAVERMTRERARDRPAAMLELCSRAIALGLEDDAPIDGTRAVFPVDIENPCWIYRGAELSGVRSIGARVGQVPFNFQIGAERDKIHFPDTDDPAGELQVRLDSCQGPTIARLSLKPAAAFDTVSALAPVPIEPIAGRHDLCLQFAQHGLDPLWTLDAIEVREQSAGPAVGSPK